METTIIGFRVMLGFYSGPSNVVPFWVWYGFWLGLLGLKVLHWRV